MNKIISLVLHNKLKATTFCCLFLIMSSVAIFAVTLQEQQQPSYASASITAVAATETVVASATVPVATPTPVPTTEPSPTPTPIPTKTPTPKPTPTPTLPVQPTPTVDTGVIPPPAGVTPTQTPGKTPTPKPSPTPSPTATATSEATPTSEAMTGNSSSSPNATTQQGDQMSLLAPVGIGASIVLVLGALMGLAFMRKNPISPKGRPQVTNAAAAMVASTASSNIPWSRQTSLETPLPSTINDHMHSPTPALPPVQPMSPAPALASARPIQPPITPNPMVASFTQQQTPMPAVVPTFTYQPGDLRPLTAPLPRQIPTSRAQVEPTQEPTNTMRSLSMDSLDFSTIMAEFDEAPAQHSNPPSLLPPTIQDDPVLETIMRQAQMGLYAIPTRPPKEKDDRGETGKVNSFIPL